jgi:ABC-type nitrate/sulfonate/bicarbonate transport system substrate-binding protein
MFHRIHRRLALAGAALTLAFSAAAQTVQVAPGLSVESMPKVTGELNFAHGFGLIYGAMPVARYLGVMEKVFPNAKVTWQNIFTTAQQRDAMLANRLDIGSCTPGPFLSSWDKGVDMVWLQTTGGFDGYLMTRPDGPSKITDFIGTTKKMSPGPNTAQYYTVQEALRKAGKDVKSLDRNWVNLPHADAMQALIGKQLDGHFATADFALRLQEAGMKKVLSIKDTWGSLYGVGACTLKKIADEHPDVMRGYSQALKKTVEWMNANPEKASEVMSKSVDNKVPPAEFLKFMKSGMAQSYTTDADLKTQANAMHAFGAISKLPKDAKDFYVYPAEAGSKW